MNEVYVVVANCTDILGGFKYLLDAKRSVELSYAKIGYELIMECTYKTNDGHSISIFPITIFRQAEHL